MLTVSRYRSREGYQCQESPFSRSWWPSPSLSSPLWVFASAVQLQTSKLQASDGETCVPNELQSFCLVDLFAMASAFYSSVHIVIDSELKSRALHHTYGTTHVVYLGL